MPADAPQLILGPALRYVDERQATVWVETDGSCEVEVLGHTAQTFEVAGHHYALVTIDGLEPGGTYEYEVALDGERRWPPRDYDWPPGTIRTPAAGERLRVAFGSCRVAVPHEPPWTNKAEDHECGFETDALLALAERMRARDPAERPHLLVLVGDQVYADEGSPQAREFFRSRRDTSEPPGEEVADFEEYTRLYWESWGEPAMRWLLSTLPTAMICDDHELHDDWNISHEWVEEMRTEPWWEERVEGAFMSYWIYQHIGNLSPEQIAGDELLEKLHTAEDPTEELRRYARREDRETKGRRWSYHRDICGSRLVVIDSRAGRVLGERHREMLDEDEWSWLEEWATGDVDHLLIATSLPLMLGLGMHNLEAWSEPVADGAWGGMAAKLAEKLRRGLDLEHWAAFESSFRRLTEHIRDVGAGLHGEPPASIVVLSGDVHHAYLADVAFRRSAGVRSRVWQAVCSPLRNPLDRHERLAIRIGASRPMAAVKGLLARAAGVHPGEVRWRFSEGPWFDNQLGWVELDGRRADFKLEKASGPLGATRLETVCDRRLA